MGLISLPSVDELAQEKDPKRQMEMMLNTMGILMKNLSELNGYINSKNVKEITADKISAGTINTGDITIGADESGKFYRIDGAGIVANNGTVNTLLFDLATGLMTLTSVLIQSATGFPRVIMDPSTELFGAYGTASNYTTIKAVGSSSVPEMEFVNGVKAALIRITSTLFLIQSTVDFALATSGNMDLSAANVTINGVNFNTKADKSVATSSAGSANGGIPIGTVLSVAGGGTVTWNGIPAHTHTQN